MAAQTASFPAATKRLPSPCGRFERRHARTAARADGACRVERRPGSIREPAGPRLVVQGGRQDGSVLLEHDGLAHLGGDVGEVDEGLGGVHRATVTQGYSSPVRAVFAKFFADRGTHLAAMIAYFALLSFVPLLFLTLALLGFAHRPDESSVLVEELSKLFPRTSVRTIVSFVTEIQKNAAALGILGGIFIFWTSLSLFSVLESAFNIVYGRPNRSFLHGKALALGLLTMSLVTLFFGLIAGSFGSEILKRSAPGFAANVIVAYVLSVTVSGLAVFVFLVAVYMLLTNERLRPRDVLPGAIVATAALEASFQVLPIYLRVSKDVIALQALGGPALLLVWLYVMANVIVFGAEVNWFLSRGREPAELEEAPPGLA